jgi:hypothetical protein
MFSDSGRILHSSSLETLYGNKKTARLQNSDNLKSDLPTDALRTGLWR